MNAEDLKKLVQKIVERACVLKDQYTSETEAKVNYACIFCHSENEYAEFVKLAKSFGKILEETYSGPLFQIEPLQTVSGKLQILKIRLPDDKHIDLGDADFTIVEYSTFKEKYLKKPGFKLIERSNIELIELMDPLFDIRAYFSNPPLDQQHNIV